jgi:hypothetical protein
MGPESGTTKSGCTQGIGLTTVRQGVVRIVLDFGFVLFVGIIFCVVNPATVREAQPNDLQFITETSNNIVSRRANHQMHFFLDAYLSARKTSCDTLAEELLLATVDIDCRRKEMFSRILYKCCSACIDLL